MTDDALFIPDGDTFVPTGLTRTGWEENAQHGGPPTGLFAHVFEAIPADAPMRIMRLTVDLIRPVPLEPLAVVTRPVKEGKRVKVMAGSMLARGIEVATATALWIRVADVDMPELPSEPWEPPPGPDGVPLLEREAWESGDLSLRRFHRDAVEIRTVDSSFWTPGRGISWVRLLYPVVAGTDPTPFTRVAALSDIGNGNARSLDPDEWMFINPDITVATHRDQEDDWVGMNSIAYQHRSGVGQADTLLFDRSGPFGRVIQSQILLER